MSKRYTFGRLSKSEREILEQILLEEMDMQVWYAVTYCGVLGGEVFVMTQ